jgi:hypothetical protein
MTNLTAYEPTQAQIAAAHRLEDAGQAADAIEREWGAALTELGEAVATAKLAGIPRADVKTLASVLLLNGLGGGTGEQLRKIMRRIYG